MGKATVEWQCSYPPSEVKDFAVEVPKYSQLIHRAHYCVTEGGFLWRKADEGTWHRMKHINGRFYFHSIRRENPVLLCCTFEDGLLLQVER